MTITSPIETLEARAGASWPVLRQARTRARARRAEFASTVKHALLADTSVIVFGSLARGEFTSGSDVDWTLLVDGPADHEHLLASQQIEKALAGADAKAPGPTGVFGGLTFSHELIHHIGGEQDTNLNTTRRVLLLLESAALTEGDVVRDRVVRAVLNRYVADDRLQFRAAAPGPVPSFLLNDIARYWRTMAVDLIAKRRERQWKGWALRSIKLRMSRKLLFVAGLGACLLCRLRPHLPATEADVEATVVAQLIDTLRLEPLEVLAVLVSTFEAEDLAPELFGAYEQFLALLEDHDRRAHLEGLSPDDASGDPEFGKARAIGTRFQDALDLLFFERSEALRKATQRYGVF